MAMNTQSYSSAISPEVVGNMFVEQYYHFLHHSPEVVFKFYHDHSVLSRPDSNGFMTSTTTMQGINEKILSLGFKDYKAEIKTADAQKSHGDGVIVVVTGCLTGKDNLKRNFTQTFFLAPQDNGYFVLNDVCRYIENVEPLETDHVNKTEYLPIQAAPLKETAQIIGSPAPAPAPAPAPDLSSALNVNIVEKTLESVDTDEVKAAESSVDVEIVPDSKDNGVSVVDEPLSSTVSEEALKKSYASIVSSESKLSTTHGKKATASRQGKIYVPTNTRRAIPKVVPEKAEKGVDSGDHPSVPETVNTSDVATKNNDQPEEGKLASHLGEGHSVYIRNLPYDVTVAEVEAAFENFGSIKKEGIQVRCHKDVGHCFGFVEFQSADSMNKAVEASPISVGGRQVIVEIKRTTSRAGMPRRFFQGRSYSQIDNNRGRGNFSGSGGWRTYNRNEYGQRGDFSTRNNHMPAFRGGVYQRGRGKFGHNPAPIAA